MQSSKKKSIRTLSPNSGIRLLGEQQYNSDDGYGTCRELHLCIKSTLAQQQHLPLVGCVSVTSTDSHHSPLLHKGVKQ